MPDVIPKWWLNAIRVPGGPFEGQLAKPCQCGDPTELDGDRTVWLLAFPDGSLMFVHEDCAGSPDES